VTVYVVLGLRFVIVTMTVPSAGIWFAETDTGTVTLPALLLTTTALLLMPMGKLPPFVICNVAVVFVTSRIVSVADSAVGMWVFVPAPMRPETHPYMAKPAAMVMAISNTVAIMGEIPFLFLLVIL